MNLDTEHGKVEALLPWYANNALDGDERRRVGAHVEHCAKCREEVEFLDDVRAVLRISAAAEQPAPVPRNVGFSSLPTELQARVLATPRGRWRKRHWLPAMAAGFVAAIGLGVALTIAYMDAPRFRTATSGSAVAAGDSALVSVRFVPDVALREMNRLLRQHDAIVVRGPGANDEWILEIPLRDGGEAAQLLPVLRSTTGVESVELAGSVNETE